MCAYAERGAPTREKSTSKEKGMELRQRQMLDEYKWIVRQLCTPTLNKIDDLCVHASRRLPTKLAASTQQALQPEKITLATTGGSSDALRAALTLMADNILQADVAVRYARAPGHILRTVAQPAAQWKLQQIQDSANYIEKALQLIDEAKRMIQAACTDNECCSLAQAHEDSAHLRQTLSALVDQLVAARNALLLPRKRSLRELREHVSNQSFNPSLPPDLTLSFYIAGDRLTCAAYHVQSTAIGPGGTASQHGAAHQASADGTYRQTFLCMQADAQLPWLHETLTRINIAVAHCAQLRDKLDAVSHVLPVA